jgi:type IV pilus assembly protein PilF
MKRVSLIEVVRVLIASACILAPAVSFSEHPIDVQRLSASGNHYEALLAFHRLPDRQINAEARLAAARSAWAMSLPSMAIDQLERALQSDKLSNAQRAQALLTRSIIELQEERVRIAPIYAEKALKILPSNSPLRARAWMVWGESLHELGTYSAAKQKYEKALKEADTEMLPDLHFRMGICSLQLGELDSAEQHFENIPLSHPRAPQAVRELASIALERRQYDKAQFWLKKARADYQEDFLDSWVDFGLYRSAFALGDKEAAASSILSAQEKFPPSDDWFTLMLAEAESQEWRAALRHSTPKSDQSKVQKTKTLKYEKKTLGKK